MCSIETELAKSGERFMSEVRALLKCVESAPISHNSAMDAIGANLIAWREEKKPTMEEYSGACSLAYWLRQQHQ